MTKLSIICQIILINSVILTVLSVEDDCPIGKYQCKSTAKMCIELTAICNGKNDCPEGEDELSSYCKESAISKHYQKYNPGKAYVNEEDHYVKVPKEKVKTHVLHKNNTNNEGDQGDRYWPNNGCSAGHYLCNGTLNICVKFDDICNGVQNCPQNDDEDPQACMNRPTQPRTIALNDAPAIVLDQSGSNERNFDGTGFMFHVDNLIIYNSDVRMFNQNSDNNGN